MDENLKETLENLVAIDAEIIIKAFSESVACGEAATRDAILSFKDYLAQNEGVRGVFVSITYRSYILKLMAQVTESLNEWDEAVFIRTVLLGGQKND